MQYDEIHRRYGGYLARRLHEELPPEDFQKLTIDQLLDFLEASAAELRTAYMTAVGNPFIRQILQIEVAVNATEIYRQWQSTADLAYLIGVANDAAASGAYTQGKAGSSASSRK